jgi:tetratricopeptide (TPR) repeat protein
LLFLLKHDLISIHKEAIEDFDRALQEKPDFLDAYILRGRAKWILEQHKEAMKDFDRANFSNYALFDRS